MLQIFSEDYRRASDAVRRAEKAKRDGSDKGADLPRLREQQKQAASRFMGALNAGSVSQHPDVLFVCCVWCITFTDFGLVYPCEYSAP